MIKYSDTLEMQGSEYSNPDWTPSVSAGLHEVNPAFIALRAQGSDYSNPAGTRDVTERRVLNTVTLLGLCKKINPSN